jgi:hypothetical protein
MSEAVPKGPTLEFDDGEWGPASGHPDITQASRACQYFKLREVATELVNRIGQIPADCAGQSRWMTTLCQQTFSAIPCGLKVWKRYLRFSNDYQRIPLSLWCAAICPIRQMNYGNIS